MTTSPSTPESVDITWTDGLTDEDLLRERRLALEREGRLASIVEEIDQDLGELAISDGVRANLVYRNSEVTGLRKVTDPYKTEPELDQAGETLKSRATFKPVTGVVADKFSLNGPNGARITAGRNMAQAPAAPGDWSKRDRKRDVRSAKREQKQRIRQLRTKETEALYGGSIGLGVTARKSSAVRRWFSLNPQTRQRYESGQISATEMLAELQSNRRNNIVVPVKAVRRNVRRERAGSAYNLTMASQPVARRIRTAQIVTNFIDRSIVGKRLDRVRSSPRRADIEAEVRRRGLIDDDDED